MRWTTNAILVAGALSAGCAPRSPSAPETPDVEAMVHMIERISTIDSKPYDDARLSAYVNAVSSRVAAHAGLPDRRIEVTVNDVAAVQASAGFAGNVTIDRGLIALMGSESELAAVLAHEIGHVAAGHPLYMFVNAREASDPGAPFLRYALLEDHQIQADRLAAGYLRAAGYAPRALLRLLRLLDRASLARCELSGDVPQRLASLARHGADVEGGEVGRDRYLDRIDGLVYGERPVDGAPLRIRVRRVTMGGRFDHVMAGLCKGVSTISDLAILNGVEKHTEIEAGTRLKCVGY